MAGPRIVSAQLAAIVAIAAFTVSIQAQPFTWTGGGDGTTWTDTNNWDQPTAPAAQGDNDVIINFGTPQVGNRDVGRTSAGSQTMTGGSLDITGVHRYGVLTGGGGTGTQSGGTITSSSRFELATQSGTTASYDLSGTGILESSHFSIGRGGVGVFNQSGGWMIANGTSGSFIGQTGDGTYNLSGGTLYRDSEQGVSLAPGSTAIGRMYQTGGSIVLTNGGGFGVGTAGTGIYTIENGSIYAGSLTVAAAGAVSGTLTIGENAEMDFVNGFELGATGEINFLFDTTGVSMMNFGGAGTIDSSGVINVDGSAYAGGPGSFTLIDAASFDNTPVINLSGFDDGAVSNWDLASGNFIVTIPEPATSALISLGVLGLMLSFRRRQGT